MKKYYTILIAALASVLTTFGQSADGKPFGFAVCTSMTDATPYPVTGGGNGKRIVLQSNGGDMRQQIMDAINLFEVIVLDGSKGDFMVSETMHIDNTRNKTIIGANNARVCTKFRLTKEILHILDSLDVRSHSTTSDGTVYELSNGNKVREKCESVVRQTLIDLFNDPSERFRECGLFAFSGVENVIVQNLKLRGPGAIDIGGDDLMTLSHKSRHVWIDHCDFEDGADGNFDINSFSDLITISWCHFHYSDMSYMHQNTNLVGSSDRVEWNGEDELNITFAYNHWGKGCKQRMPMVRFGTIHLLNNYYDCVNNAAAINPRRHSEVLMEGNYFLEEVQNVFHASDDAKAYVFRNNKFPTHFTQPADKGKVIIPYKYKVMKPDKLAKLMAKP